MSIVQLSIIMGFLLLILALQVGIFIMFLLVRKQKENEYYTDYIHNKTILRVYKPEFEYQAIGDLKPTKILDRGILSPFYNWALIEI